ncbi:hypothetical protein [Runella sp.]|uniref:hypothetical protein n=1 Tax=Runella sp. TaxID=1960881 RepID=UPI003D09B61A
MGNQIQGTLLSIKDIEKAIEALEEKGFYATVSGVFVRGNRRVTFVRNGFIYKDGLSKEHSFTLEKLMEKLKKL